MEVAIIGAGFCGLAAAWHMLQNGSAIPRLKVTLFDAKGTGKEPQGYLRVCFTLFQALMQS